MHRSLVCLLIVVAYFGFASAQLHIKVQAQLANDFISYIGDRAYPLKWDTAKFPIFDATGDDYTFLATYKLAGDGVDSLVLAAGSNATVNTTLTKQPNPKAFYASASTSFAGNTEAVYRSAKAEFVKNAQTANMNCDYIASVETVCTIKTDTSVLGTYFVVAFIGYTEKVDPKKTGIALESATISWSGVDIRPITFRLSDFQ